MQAHKTRGLVLSMSDRNWILIKASNTYCYRSRCCSESSKDKSRYREVRAQRTGRRRITSALSNPSVKLLVVTSDLPLFPCHRPLFTLLTFTDFKTHRERKKKSLKTQTDKQTRMLTVQIIISLQTFQHK